MRRLNSIIVSLFISLTCFSQNNARIDSIITKASLGDADSQEEIILYYYFKKDYSELISWCNTLLANPTSDTLKRGNTCKILGYLSLNGYGVEKSFSNAIKYWEYGVGYGNVFCASLMANIYNGVDEYNDDSKAWHWFVKAADMGDKKSCKFVAAQYESPHVIVDKDQKIVVMDGEKVGVTVIHSYPVGGKDMTKALHYYNKYLSLVESQKRDGHRQISVEPTTKYKVSNMYYWGQNGVEQNYEKALSIFESIIREDANKEMYFLSDGEQWLSDEEIGEVYWLMSVCYRFGRGVVKNSLAAMKYTNKAAKNGNKKAIELLKNNGK